MYESFDLFDMLCGQGQSFSHVTRRRLHWFLFLDISLQSNYTPNSPFKTFYSSFGDVPNFINFQIKVLLYK